MSVSFIQFDAGKPFYNMVGTFLVSISASPVIFSASNPMKLDKSQYISIGGVQVGDKHLFPLEVFEQAKSGHITMPTFLGYCCMMLANTAYESVKDSNDHSPEFEFLRHVRNACSHNNKFNFYAHEPSRPAAWRSITIDHSQKGASNPLHGTQCFGSVLGPADIVELLADVEKRIAA